MPASRMFRVPGGVFEVTGDADRDGPVRVCGVVCDGSPDADGYLRVEYGRRKFYKHVLVILAWQGEPQVRHLGNSNQDNRPTELAWGSRRENGRDKGKKKERRREGKGEVSPPSQRLQPVTGGLLR